MDNITMEKEEKIQNNVTKSIRNKILLFGILAVVLIGLIIWAIQVITTVNYYKREKIDAGAFVSKWNARSNKDDLLTGGLKISDSSGDHEYQLDNGCTLRYSVNTYWWVKYMTTNVILEFPAENQEKVYDLSKLFLEVFDEIEAVNEVFERAYEKVDTNRLKVLERFSVGVDGESQEAYATFVEAQIIKSNAYIGYSWNLTIEEWCENFNKNLDVALEDAMQAAYSWLVVNFPDEVANEKSLKAELRAMNRERYKPLNASDFKEIGYYSNGIHENKVYQFALPSWDNYLNIILLVIDENGYIFDCRCIILQGIFDVVNQMEGGDRSNYFMEFYGYPTLVCTGTGTSYSVAIKAVEKLLDTGVGITEVSDDVSMGKTINQLGPAVICVPNREGVVDEYNAIIQSGEWQLMLNESQEE